MKPDPDDGSEKISADFLDSVKSQEDTLDNFLDFLKKDQSPVSTTLELRSLLLSQKEEKLALQSLVDQMKVDMQGIR